MISSKFYNLLFHFIIFKFNSKLMEENYILIDGSLYEGGGQV
jgi:hypothetical protein